MSQFPLWSHTTIRAAGAAGSKTHNLRELMFQEWSKLEKGEMQGPSGPTQHHCSPYKAPPGGLFEGKQEDNL